MKLIPDCIRAVLLSIEACPYGQHLFIDQLAERISGFTLEELQYTCLKLEEGGYLHAVITGACTTSPEVCSITDLTFNGHELLAKIKDDRQWHTVKTGLSSVRNYSLSAISALAEGVSTAAITAFLSKKPNP